MFELIDHLDKALLIWFNSLHNPFLDQIMLFASAKYGWIVLYLFLLFLIVKKYKKNSILILLFIALAIIMSDQFSVHLFKNIFQRLRPCHQQELVKHLWLPAGCGGTYSFVSSHAANSFSLATFISLLFGNKRLTISMFTWASIIAISRIYLAAHFLSDVIAGALLGFATGWLSHVLYRLVKEKLYVNKE